MRGTLANPAEKADISDKREWCESWSLRRGLGFLYCRLHGKVEPGDTDYDKSRHEDEARARLGHGTNTPVSTPPCR